MFSVKVPGSLMLLGEHSVLHNKVAISFAIDKHIFVDVEKNNSNKIIIYSEQFGNYETNLKNIEVHKPFHFILEAIKLYPEIDFGLTIKIRSEFLPTLGLGSSAAVTVGVIAAINKILFNKQNKLNIFQDGLKVIRNIQGFGSGADLAASIYGGVIKLDEDIEKISDYMPINVVYSGYKTPTIEVVSFVKKRFSEKQDLLYELFEFNKNLVNKAVVAVKEKNWVLLGEILNISNGFYESLGILDENLNEIMYEFKRAKGIFGTKVSGSGMGDCIIAIGNNVNISKGKKLNLNVTSNGIVVQELIYE